jgi:hypothetical protein
MAWSGSEIFRQYIADSLNRTAALDLNADSFKAAAYNNSITPDQDAAAASTAYNAGQWANTNEVSESGQWAAGGVALTSVVVDVATSAVVMFDAADTASGTAADLANVHGVLVYDDTLTTPVADQGVCYNYLGGANSVVNGQFTVVWAATGIFRLTL